MTRGTPPSDWVAYVTVLVVVAATMYGKYLIGRGDKPIDEVVKEDILEAEEKVEEIIDEIEEKIK